MRKTIGDVLLPIHIHIDDTPEAYIPYDEAANAMDQFADQEMEAFAEWTSINDWHYFKEKKRWGECSKSPDQRTYLTTQQLITKYKEEQNGY